MLKQILGLMVFSGLIFASSMNLMAQEEKTDAPLQVEEVRQLREAAKAINQILSGEDEEEKVNLPGAGRDYKKPTKTPAEVADKALTILSGYIGSAAKTMEKVAPEVWRVMIRQQYAKALGAPIFDFSVLCFTGLYVVIMKRWWTIKPVDKENVTTEYGWWFFMTNILPTILVFVFGLIAAWHIKGSIQMLINPEYYAFSDLLKLLLNKGMIN